MHARPGCNHAHDDQSMACWAPMHRTVPKKVCAGAFSGDGAHAIFADKFGDVHVAAVGSSSSGAAQANTQSPVRILLAGCSHASCI